MKNVGCSVSLLNDNASAVCCSPFPPPAQFIQCQTFMRSLITFRPTSTSPGCPDMQTVVIKGTRRHYLTVHVAQSRARRRVLLRSVCRVLGLKGRQVARGRAAPVRSVRQRCVRVVRNLHLLTSGLCWTKKMFRATPRKTSTRERVLV